ncbi:MAG: hypothetical protein VXZ55_02240, partial [Planctomycetota bacterium]|nr:hypothetical protein [Planctomycetota bacterium]
ASCDHEATLWLSHQAQTTLMTVNSRALRLGRRFTGAQVLSHKVHCDPLDGVDFGGERRIKKAMHSNGGMAFSFP